MYVAKDLSKLDNFDLSSVIKDMNTIKEQMKFLQEAQESSLNVHAAICKSAHDKKRKKKSKTPTLVTTTSSAPTVSSPPSTPPAAISPPSASTVNSPVGEAAPAVQQNEDIPESDDDDIIRLAELQGFKTNGDSNHGSYSCALRQPKRQPRESRQNERHHPRVSMSLQNRSRQKVI